MPPLTAFISLFLNTVLAYLMLRSSLRKSCPLFVYAQTATIPAAMTMMITYTASPMAYATVYDPAEAFCIGMEVLSIVALLYGCFSEAEILWIFSLMALHFILVANEYLLRFGGLYSQSMHFYAASIWVNHALTVALICVVYAVYSGIPAKEKHDA